MTLVPELDREPARAAPTTYAPPSSGNLLSRDRWIREWDPEDHHFWDNGGKDIARRNLWWSIFAEHIGFAVWTMWGTLLLFLGPEYGLAPHQKFTLVTMAAAVGAAARIPYTLAVAKFGGRNWTIVSASLLLIPSIAAAILLEPGISYSTLLILAAIAGVGGGNFASSMSNINNFYPDREKGWALGLNAAGGNLGVATVKLLGLAVLATIGAQYPRVLIGIIIPFIVLAILGAYLFMDNIADATNEKGAMREACKEPHTWVISFLYIGTFGSFIGFGFAFGQVLLLQFPDIFDEPRKAAYLTFLGPLLGSVSRPLGGKWADRIGGAIITFWNFVAMGLCAGLVLLASHQGSLALFLIGFIGLFITSGIGNGSTYKMIPGIFRGRAQDAIAAGMDPAAAYKAARRRSGALIGIAGAAGAFGGVFVNIAFRESFLANGNGNVAYLSFVVIYVVMAALTWAIYMQQTPSASAAQAKAARALQQPIGGSGATTMPVAVDRQPAAAGADRTVAGTITAASFGTVRGAVDAATLTLIDQEGVEVARTTSAANGSFDLQVPAWQRFLLVCSAPGYAALAALVEPGEGVAQHHLMLAESPEEPGPTGCDLVGTVTGPHGPISWALVTLTDAEGAVRGTGRTDNAGHYRLDAGLGGQVTVTVVAPGLHPAASTLTLTAGAQVHDIRLG